MSATPYELGFIGAGKLAGSVIRGLLRKKFCAADAIIASEPNAEARAALSDLGIGFTTKNAEVTQGSPIIFLGVKPAAVLSILRELGDGLAGKLIASFAAGIRIADMEMATPARVMRVMTNTPGAIGRAATAFAPGGRSTETDGARIGEIFGAIGAVVRVTDDEIDAVTALAGSGPAFVYTVIEALAAGGAKCGLSSDVALTLATQTVLGAAQLASESGLSPEELRKMVITPGGTTAAGLAAMEKLGTAEGLIAAVHAAAERGREMSQPSESR